MESRDCPWVLGMSDQLKLTTLADLQENYKNMYGMRINLKLTPLAQSFEHQTLDTSSTHSLPSFYTRCMECLASAQATLLQHSKSGS